MDPISQAAVGAAASQSACRSTQLKQAALFGGLAGMAPDLDIFIRSANDPLLALEFHRHFTHSLFFIPIGALLCATVFYFFLKIVFKKSNNSKHQPRDFGDIKFQTFYLWCFLGYATHGLLDGCTTYGTRLLWPLSDARIAWNTISVIDPLFTLPLITFLILAIVKRSRRWHIAAVSWLFFYIIFGLVQHERAEIIGKQLAEQRGHQPIHLTAKPSFANIIVWKIVYEYNGQFYVDAVRPGLKEPRIWEGSSIKKFDKAKDFSWLNPNAQQTRDIERFTHFSSGFVAIDPLEPNNLVDIRYSSLPQQIEPMWGIQLDREKENTEHAHYFVRRDPSSRDLGALIRMLYK